MRAYEPSGQGALFPNKKISGSLLLSGCRQFCSVSIVRALDCSQQHALLTVCFVFTDGWCWCQGARLLGSPDLQLLRVVCSLLPGPWSGVSLDSCGIAAALAWSWSTPEFCLLFAVLSPSCTCMVLLWLLASSLSLRSTVSSMCEKTCCGSRVCSCILYLALAG